MQEYMFKVFHAINGENVALILFFIGVYGLLARRNIIKSIISLGIMQAASVLFFVSINAADVNQPPIGVVFGNSVADPLPQALMITAVVIGVSITALCLIMFITQYHVYGSTNWNRVRRNRKRMEI
tara:strand:+ start:48 stop:425 length:378 start_codon:yes stop_codon:yes gene_type:complete